MSKQIIKTVEVQAGVNPGFLENTLTTDITVLESIFDLIDNSIDAARDHLLSQNFEADIYGLPKDYSGYKISIRLSEKSISILDNCLGMEESMLTKKVFMTAGASNHKFGIGHYGLGLKRALLKFGSQYAMSSDNGKIAFKMHFDGAMIAGNQKLIAEGYDTLGHRKVLFVVTGVKPSIAYEFQSKPWFENAVNMLKLRYAVYIAKGLKLSITDACNHERVKIDSVLPTLRSDAKFHPVSTPFKIDGVDVYIDSGIHHEYYFAKEAKHSLAKNKELTNYFGLYFICNDRVIVAASTAIEHGWKTKWHSEYNGYICIVRFVSADSSKMPWNTLKTALKTDGRMFVEVRNKLLPIAESFRASVRKYYLNKSVKTESKENPDSTVNPPPVKHKPNDTVTANSTEPNSSQRHQVKPAQMAGNNPQAHVKNWDSVLPTDFPISKNDALNAFLIDAVNLKCHDAPCASALLLRAILEKSLKNFVNKSGNFKEVKNHFYCSAEGLKKNHSEEYKANQGIDLAMMLNWLKDEKTATKIFGIEEKPTLWLAAKQAATHVKKLNGITHGNDFIATEQLLAIRNEMYVLIRFCVLSSDVEN